MLLDKHTLLFALMLISLMMALSLAVVSLGRQHDSLKKWAAAMGLETLAWLLLNTQGELPLIISLKLGLLLISSGLAMKLAAIHEYRGMPWPRLQCMLPVLLVALLLLVMPIENLRLRLVSGSVIYGAQLLMLLRVLHTDTESRSGHAWWLLYGAVATILAMFVVRGISALFNLVEFATPQSAQPLNPVQLVLFIVFIATSIMGSMGFFLMVMERAERTANALAMIDSLTGVFNRRAFMERAEKEFAIAQRNKTPLALLMIDIDFFKRINDEYGHPVGDEVLLNIARTLNLRLRKQDTLGRYGGEEFCVLLPATDEQGALALAEMLRRVIEESPVIVKPKEIVMTISIGVTVWDMSCDAFHKLVDVADRALYQAKDSGRNRVVALPLSEPVS